MGTAIVALNLAYDPSCATPGALLERYHTLTGWSRALTAAGATVTVVQRFSTDRRHVLDDVPYVLVRDAHPALLAADSVSEPSMAATIAANPDVVHVNGLMFPGMLRALSRALPDTVLVVQDHSGLVPRHPPWPVGPHRAAHWRAAFAPVDAFSFTAAALARRWQAAGLPEDARIVEIPEASTTLAPADRTQARLALGAAGDPAIVWIGRLDANKDPLTVLDGLERALPRIPRAHCWLIYGPPSDLEDVVRHRLHHSPALGRTVTMVGTVPHPRVAGYLSAADLMVSGSHHEGSGYSLIEAMACGVAPCVTDIPAHRAIVGDCGALWRAGDAAACAEALVAVATGDRASQSVRARQRFADVLAWDAIARTTLHHYGALVANRRRSAS